MNHFPGKREFLSMVYALLSPEAKFYKVVFIYSIGISLLTLSVPISVQLLIDTVANTGLPSAVIMIALLLSLLLGISAVLYALRDYTMELFKRRIYARITSEIALSTLNTSNDYFRRNNPGDLLNRYFDILILKKNVPGLVANGFTLLFQALIGFVLVSLYHFYFLVFSLVLVVLLCLVWVIWGWRAVYSNFALSEAKYRTASWLENLAWSHSFYWRGRNQQRGLEKTDAYINDFLDKQETHYGFSFRQLVALLVTGILSSAVLLGIGGWLVIQGELSLGQLVAAELIMSAIFAFLPQLATYLDMLYEVCAAVEEVSRFNRLPQHSFKATKSQTIDEASLVVRNLPVGNIQIDLDVSPGSLVQISTTFITEYQLLQILLHQSTHPKGIILVSGRDIDTYDSHELKARMMILDQANVPEITISDYLNFGMDEVSSSEKWLALEIVGLDALVHAQPQGLGTYLTHSGLPLSTEQILKLKLAHALVARVRILILGRIFDLVDNACLDRAAGVLASVNNSSVIYFSETRQSENKVKTLSFYDKEAVS